MYKVSIAHLKAFKEALQESNRLLKITLETFDDDVIKRAIYSNDKQIKIITEQFHIDETRN
jgi:hypothetical protein